jgi:hypothetical protein
MSLLSSDIFGSQHTRVVRPVCELRHSLLDFDVQMTTHLPSKHFVQLRHSKQISVDFDEQ